MQAPELKSLVESGTYKPDPAQIAVAMLRRRGVRELLTGIQARGAAARGGESGRSQPPEAARPRAA